MYPHNFGLHGGQPFYLGVDGNPVVMFEEYEIAPGYMGIQEFEIPLGE